MDNFFFSATIPTAIFAILASYGDCNEAFVVTMFSLAISAQGFSSSGMTLIPFDLGPNYSGPLYAVVHTSYSVAALLAPFIVSIFTPHVNRLFQALSFKKSQLKRLTHLQMCLNLNCNEFSFLMLHFNLRNWLFLNSSHSILSIAFSTFELSK